MQCCLCQKVALYVVNKDGYCKDHRAEAVERRTHYCRTVLEAKSSEYPYRSTPSRALSHLLRRMQEKKLARAAKALGDRGHGTRDPLDGAVKEPK